MKQNRLPAAFQSKLKSADTYPLSLLYLKGYYKIFWQKTPTIVKTSNFDMIIIHKYKIYPVKDSAERGRAYSFLKIHVFFFFFNPK